jgi:branched-chain amino acid transport system substrate-binding protein
MAQRIWAAWLWLRRVSAGAGRRGLLGGAVFLALTACSQAESGGIPVGVLPYLTGLRAATSGRQTVEGTMLAAEEINAKGGVMVNGRRRRIKLIFADAGQQEEVGASSARSLINLQRVVALIGPQFSVDAMHVARLAEAIGLPMITPMSTHPKVTDGRRWVFRLAYRDDFQGEVMARFARERLGLERAAMLYDVTDDYGRGLAEVFRRQFEARGGRIVADERFTPDTKSDFRPQLRRIKAAGAEVIFSPTYLDAGEAQLTQSRELGMRITFLGPDAWDPGLMIDAADLQQVYVVFPWHHEIGTPESDGFVSRFTARYGKTPLATEASSYDAVMILADAISRAGTVDPEPLRAAIAATRYRGATGKISFPGNGDPRRSAFILRPSGTGVTLVEEVRP